METQQGVHVALAHDDTWMRSRKDQVLMTLLNDEMTDFAVNGLEAGGYPHQSVAKA